MLDRGRSVKSEEIVLKFCGVPTMLVSILTAKLFWNCTERKLPLDGLSAIMRTYVIRSSGTSRWEWALTVVPTEIPMYLKVMCAFSTDVILQVRWALWDMLSKDGPQDVLKKSEEHFCTNYCQVLDCGTCSTHVMLQVRWVLWIMLSDDGPQDVLKQRKISALNSVKSSTAEVRRKSSDNKHLFHSCHAASCSGSCGLCYQTMDR